MGRMIRTTLIGGIFFLIPVAFLGVVLAEAYAAALKAVLVLDRFIPVSTIGGAALLGLLALVLVLAVCLGAGLLAQLPFIADRVKRLDSLLSGVLPGYAVAKSVLGGVTGEDLDAALTVVLVAFDDHEMLAFEVERLEDGRVVVFLPGAPAAWSGSTVLVSPDKVTRLAVKPHQVVGAMRVLGRGTAAALAARPAPEHAANAG